MTDEEKKGDANKVEADVSKSTSSSAASAASDSASASASASVGAGAAQTSAGGNGAVFAIKRIFVRDISFEMPGGLESFAIKGAPKVAQDLNTEISNVDEHHFMVTLKMTITVKADNEKVAYLVEVHQAGVFQISGFNTEQTKHILTAQCPTILYPYIREAVDCVVVKGGFPPLALPPLNFDAIVAKVGAEAQARAAAASAKGNA